MAISAQDGLSSRGAKPAVRPANLDPEGLAIDIGGWFYIADAANNRVLQETPSYGDYTVIGIGSG